MKRRKFLTLSSLVIAAAALPRILFARPAKAFDATSKESVLSNLFEGRKVTTSDKVNFKVPPIAENGAVVPVTISTDLADVKTISLIVNENPTPLVALFHMQPSSVPDVSTRIKMGKTSKVMAIVDAGGKLYGVEKEVKVTIGGCGG